MFRDYEDVPETATRWQLAQELAFNQLGKFGTTKLGTNDGVGVDPVLVNGADGQGLGFNTKADGGTSGAFAAATTKGYSTGKIYIAFDMQRKSDAELDEQDGTTDGYKMVTNAETGAEEKKYVRQIVAYANYFKDFKKTLSKTTLQKIYQVFIYIMTQEQIPIKFFKAISGIAGLYEIRVEESGNIYRIFCCMDEGRLVILFNGFQKKTQKTPSEEIERAKRIMDEYFAQKRKEK